MKRPELFRLNGLGLKTAQGHIKPQWLLNEIEVAIHYYGREGLEINERNLYVSVLIDGSTSMIEVTIIDEQGNETVIDCNKLTTEIDQWLYEREIDTVAIRETEEHLNMTER